MKYLFETLIIYHLNPNYVLISDNMYYSIRKIITLIYDPKDIKTYLKLLGEIIALFGYFIYLEIFQLKCFGLNYDTRLSITRRSKLEVDNCEEIEDGDDDDVLHANKKEKNETEDGKNKTSKENEMVNLVDTFDENN